MLLLARIIPFILRATDKMHYNCFLLLLKILPSSHVPIHFPSCLRVLIEGHHSIFVTLYPDVSFISKLVHYLKQILEQGPLVRARTIGTKGN